MLDKVYIGFGIFMIIFLGYVMVSLFIPEREGLVNSCIVQDYKDTTMNGLVITIYNNDNNKKEFLYTRSDSLSEKIKPFKNREISLNYKEYSIFGNSKKEVVFVKAVNSNP